MTGRPDRTALGLILVACFSVSVAAASTRYDPRLRFKTISTSRFDIHFHQGEDGIARRLASFVDGAASEVDRAIGAAVGRVQIILVDQHDLSNGWATPLPYNTIEISAAAPAAESSVGNTDDWLRLVFIHEYTHIAHLSRAGGWIGGLRRGFGRLPLLFPESLPAALGHRGDCHVARERVDRARSRCRRRLSPDSGNGRGGGPVWPPQSNERRERRLAFGGHAVRLRRLLSSVPVGPIRRRTAADTRR